ncbi:TetR/AcrR family transcriptional regulator [Undibacterium sp. Di27W]|uniref:TetR/AcrR family transcriptional regulator n=1 Tax=Undibacterium sp. Di27W TaxID=3413036 RepID=UPI003BF0F033
MNSENKSHAPLQERSRSTALRLLNATIALLDESGLEGALIPRIAEHAGVAPASVYRRFADKNALLRAAFLHALKQSNVSNSASLRSQLLGDTLATSVRKLIVMLFDQYQQHPHFLRALSQFIDADTDRAFIAEARTIIRANIDLIVDILLQHESEIRHVVPAASLRFLVLNATCSIEAYSLDPNSMWHVEPCIGRAEMTDQLVHGFVSYLAST